MPPDLTTHDPDHPVATVTRALLRMIHQRGLRPGDQVPPQDDLRGLPGFSNRTLGPAMQCLVDHGVISRKPRVGTLVVNPHAMIPDLWRVAVVIPPIASEAFYAQLLQLLQVHLRAVGAVVHIVAQRPANASTASKRVTPAGFAGIDALAPLLAAGRVDGVLAPIRLDAEDWSAWAKRGVHLGHAGSWIKAPAGAVIDQAALMTSAIPALAALGCQVVGVVDQRMAHEADARALKAAKAAADRHGVQVHFLHHGHGPEGGWQAGNTVLALSAAQRPQGLVVLDDRMATGFTAALAAGDSHYRPHVVVQTNRQAPLAYALPVHHAEVDIAELAASAVDELHGRLCQPDRAFKRHWIAPKMTADQPRHLVPAPLIVSV